MECWIRRVSIAITLGACLVAAPPASAPALAAIAPSTPALSNVANVSVGGGHACAVDGAGALYCWGSNAYGQLGNINMPYSDLPIRVPGLGSGVASVSVGNTHICALMVSATVKCWGSNTNGQLGNGTTVSSTTSVDVADLGGVTALSAGADYTCAVANGAARCWGRNDQGQLGDSTQISRTTAITVSGLASGVLGIAAGTNHSCAVVSGGGARCWGMNTWTQLGDSQTTPSAVPVAVNITRSVSAIAIGPTHTCALLTSNGVQCWGFGLYGQIGDGTTAFYGGISDVVGLSAGVTAIDAGGYSSCAIVNGGVKCWGYNSNGQLGNGTTTSSTTATDVSGLTAGVQSLSVGAGVACAIAADGRLLCWGAGSLGNGTLNVLRYSPTNVVGLESGVSAIGAGRAHTCAVTSAGGVVCWGYNSNGQLGDGTSVNSDVPVTVSSLISGVVAVGGGRDYSCALLGTGGVKCWGLDYGLVPVDVPDLGSGAAVLSVGGFHACVIMTTGAARCWGNNPFGQLGDGTTTASSVPVTVTEMTSGTLAIAAGTDHTCAVIGSGGVRCWGNGARGALGNNNLNSQQANPTDVIGISSGATALAAGYDTSCALVSGLARCWGYNGSGSLGDGTRVQRNTPVAVAGLPAGMTQLYTAGAFASHICAIDISGGAFCWGANYSAQVGDGTQADRLAGTPVSGLSSGVTQIVGGAGHTCALITAGAVKCWGSRLDGQVGDGTFGYSVVPVYVGNPLPENPIRTFLPVAQANN